MPFSRTRRHRSDNTPGASRVIDKPAVQAFVPSDSAETTGTDEGISVYRQNFFLAFCILCSKFCKVGLGERPTGHFFQRR